MPRGSEGLPEMHVHQEPQNVTLCGNRIFAEVPKGQMEMRTSWGGWAAKSSAWCPCWRQTRTQRGTWAEP